VHVDGDIAQAVGERAFLPSYLTMVIVKGDRFQGVRGDILGTERIVNVQKEQAPARALPNLGQGAQEEKGEGALNKHTLPGAQAEKSTRAKWSAWSTRNRRVRALKVLCKPGAPRYN